MKFLSNKEMKKFDKKAQMMDAGTAIFESKNGYGTVLGQVKAELKEFGKVSTPDDYPQDALPRSTAEYDLFLDFSSFWRVRYIACRLEDAGDTGKKTDIGEPIRRYAVTFKEGNRTTPIRAGVHIAIILALIICSIIFDEIYIILPAIILAFYTLYHWIIPSKYSQKVTKTLLSKLSSIK